MELNVHKIALSVAITLAVVYTIGALIAAMFPGAMTSLFTWVIPVVNLAALGGISLTFGGYLLGLLTIAVVSYLVVWLFGAIHNGFTRSTMWSGLGERSLHRAHA